jgi:hypothetical protein
MVPRQGQGGMASSMAGSSMAGSSMAGSSMAGNRRYASPSQQQQATAMGARSSLSGSLSGNVGMGGSMYAQPRMADMSPYAYGAQQHYVSPRPAAPLGGSLYGYRT